MNSIVDQLSWEKFKFHSENEKKPIKKILKCVCFRCSKLLIDVESLLRRK